MKVLITGGAGYLGSIVSLVLARGGHQVRAFDSLMYGGGSLLALAGVVRDAPRGDAFDEAEWWLRDLLDPEHQLVQLLGPDGRLRMRSWRLRDDVLPLSLTRTYQQSDTGRRAFGIGATLTTIHSFFEEPLKQKLGVPDHMEIAAMIPMGYPRGAFGPVSRNPVEEVIHWDRWGQQHR